MAPVTSASAAAVSSAAKRSPLKKYPSFIKIFCDEMWTVLLASVWMTLSWHFVWNPLCAAPLHNLVYSSNSIVAQLINRLFYNEASAPSLLIFVKDFFESRLGNRTFADVVTFTLGTNIVHAVAYVLINGAFACIVHFDLLPQYRIMPRSRDNNSINNKGIDSGTAASSSYGVSKQRPFPSRQLITETLAGILRTFVLSTFTLPLLFLYCSAFQGEPTLESSMKWDASFLKQVAFFLGAVVFNHVFFYLAHRAIHEVPGLYGALHKKHHRYNAVDMSISISAEFADPIEQIVANFAPSIGFVLIFSHQIPQSVWFVWLWWRLVETFEAHSGFDFRNTLAHHLGLLRGTAANHDFHHSAGGQARSCCYGQIYLDVLLGTLDLYIESKERGTLPLAPFQEQFPNQI